MTLETHPLAPPIIKDNPSPVMLTQKVCALKSSDCAVNFGFDGHDVVTQMRPADDIMLARLNQQAGPLEDRPH